MWDVIVRRSLRPTIDALKGQKTGYAEAYSQLERDPCVIYPKEDGRSDGRPFAYRISGPLAAKVCGVHLRRNYRLAFTMRASEGDRYEGIVEILYVGPSAPEYWGRGASLPSSGTSPSTPAHP